MILVVGRPEVGFLDKMNINPEEREVELIFDEKELKITITKKD